MEFHELAGIFPMLEGAAFDALKEDIRENKQREPIWTYQGKVIDGRNRYRACEALGIKPKTQEWDGNGSLLAFIVSLNLHRRHLSESQRAMIATDISRKGRGRPENRSIDLINSTPKSPPNGGIISQPDAAKLLNVSVPTIKRAAMVARQAVPELADAVRSDKVSVSAAALVSELPKSEQSDLVSAGPLAISRRAKEVKTERVAVRPARTNPKPKPETPVVHESESDAVDRMIKWGKIRSDIGLHTSSFTDDEIDLVRETLTRGDLSSNPWNADCPRIG